MSDYPKVRMPDGAPDMLTYRQMRIQRFLLSRNSGLARCPRFIPCDEVQKLAYSPPRFPHLPSTWIGRNALRWNVHPGYGCVVLQAEQDLIDDGNQPRSAHYRIEIQEPAEGETLTDPGEGAYLSKGRIIRLVEGTHQMAFATGYGCPDPSYNAPWDVARCIGFEWQIYNTFRLARRDIDRWEKGDRVVDVGSWLPEDKRARAGDFRDLLGSDIDPDLRLTKVECGDRQSFVLLVYTPNLKVCRLRPRIFADWGLADV